MGHSLSQLNSQSISQSVIQIVSQWVNPLSPNNHTQILQSDLHTFPLRISWENLIKDQGIFSLVITLLILITISLDNLWISLGENWCWSLFKDLKGYIINQTLTSISQSTIQSLTCSQLIGQESINNYSNLSSQLINQTNNLSVNRPVQPWASQLTNQRVYLSVTNNSNS